MHTPFSSTLWMAKDSFRSCMVGVLFNISPGGINRTWSKQRKGEPIQFAGECSSRGSRILWGMAQKSFVMKKLGTRFGKSVHILLLGSRYTLWHTPSLSTTCAHEKLALICMFSHILAFIRTSDPLTIMSSRIDDQQEATSDPRLHNVTDR
jgi:hypothetical protein